MRVEAVLFDLDDTLYAEGDFFRSGFREVARTLVATGKAGEVDTIVRELETMRLGEGRDQVFDKLAQRRALPNESVPGLVHLFRSHSPRIRLLSEVPALLARLRGKGYRLGCVTDGWPDVQRRKVEALGLAPLLDTVVYTGDYGPRHWKPDPLGFVACCARLGVGAGSTVHVGDHPERDVRGARRAGIVSVRVRDERGYFSERTGEGDPPDFEIRAIGDLEGVLEAIAGGAPQPAETRSALR